MLVQVDWDGEAFCRLRDWDPELFREKWAAAVEPKVVRSSEICVLEMRQVFVGLQWAAQGLPVFPSGEIPSNWSGVKGGIQKFVKAKYGTQRLNYYKLVREMTM